MFSEKQKPMKHVPRTSPTANKNKPFLKQKHNLLFRSSYNKLLMQQTAGRVILEEDPR